MRWPAREAQGRSAKPTRRMVAQNKFASYRSVIFKREVALYGLCDIICEVDSPSCLFLSGDHKS